MRKYLLIVTSLLLLSGCANIKAVFAMMRSTDHFIALEGHPNIRYEPGAEEYAILISGYFDKSVEIVREKQGNFPSGALAFVPSSEKRFEKYCVNPVRACVIGGRLFMSPKLMREKEKIQNILTHELSHLQIQQYVGRWNAQLHIPGCFGEGLATYVSNGGGAERISRQQAIAAIKQGKYIHPEESGGLFFSRPAKVDGIPDGELSVQMFYRQSAMYVEWLYELNQSSFRDLIRAVRGGNDLNEAMIDGYGFDVKRGWERFVSDIKT